VCQLIGVLLSIACVHELTTCTLPTPNLQVLALPGLALEPEQVRKARVIAVVRFQSITATALEFARAAALPPVPLNNCEA
jgi:hypothetical protein